MCGNLLKLWRLSFLIAIILTVVANLFNFIGMVSPYWIVATEGVNSGFKSLGLWTACFDNFIFAEDYISKAYHDCWYLYKREFRYIRFWLTPNWFVFVQILSILNFICNFGAFILVLQNAAGITTNFCVLSNKPIIMLQSIVVSCTAIITIFIGLMSKDREWLPFSDRNTVSWGFALTATAGVLTLLSIFCLTVDQLADYSERIYHKLLEERGQFPPPSAASAFGLGPGSGYEVERTLRPLESQTAIPSLFLTGSVSGGQRLVTSVLEVKGRTSESGYGGQVARFGQKQAATSGAVASARLREDLQSQRMPSKASVGAASAVRPQMASSKQKLQMALDSAV